MPVAPVERSTRMTRSSKTVVERSFTANTTQALTARTVTDGADNDPQEWSGHEGSIAAIRGGSLCSWTRAATGTNWRALSMRAPLLEKSRYLDFSNVTRRKTVRSGRVRV
jgi:hypothetical protein